MTEKDRGQRTDDGGQMTDEQKKMFRLLYKFIHDERSGCGNLAAMIELQFPGDDAFAQTLRAVVSPYLSARQALGAATMDVMYMLDEAMKDADGSDEIS